MDNKMPINVMKEALFLTAFLFHDKLQMSHEIYGDKPWKVLKKEEP